MTALEVFTDVRGIISDETAVRWANSVLFRYALDGETEIVRRHPESQYQTAVTNSTPVILSDTASSFTIGQNFRTALVHYIAFRVFSEDADDAANKALAQDNFKLYLEAMG
jgi:hypothetical protein